jgi:hypothetical protein
MFAGEWPEPGHVRGERRQRTAILDFVAMGNRQIGIDMAREPFARRKPLVASGEDAHTLFEYLVERGSDERLFRLKISVKRLVLYAGVAAARIAGGWYGYDWWRVGR